MAGWLRRVGYEKQPPLRGIHNHLIFLNSYIYLMRLIKIKSNTTITFLIRK